MANNRFQDELLTLVGRRRQQEIAEDTGLSQSYLSNMLRNGRMPSRSTVIKIAEGLRLGPEERERLFRAAGFSDPLAEEGVSGAALAWPQRVAEVADVLCRLREEDLEIIQAMAGRLARRVRPRLDGAPEPGTVAALTGR